MMAGRNDNSGFDIPALVVITIITPHYGELPGDHLKSFSETTK
jgi:hypothetical protein